MEEKNSVCLKMKQRDTRATREQCKKKKRVDNKIICRKKQDCQENWLKKMEEEKERSVKILPKNEFAKKRVYKSNTFFCRDHAGILITNSEEIKKR